MKIANYQVVFREFPDEITLAFNFSGCPNRCKGCHSPYLLNDIGREATFEYISKLIEKHPYITCVGLMGGDGDPLTVNELAQQIRNKYPQLRIGWYSGRGGDVSVGEEESVPSDIDPNLFNYIKRGPYIPELGPLDNVQTNQRMWLNPEKPTERGNLKGWKNITEKFRIHLYK
jgi:anaerobic ribonucleoside-triphosphate reductase activating protein